MNWLLQVFSVILFNLRSLPQRKGSAISAAVGIAGVVGVLVGVLSISEGFRKVMQSSVDPNLAIVLRTGSDNEMNSSMSREDLRVVQDAPGVARAGDLALASGELLVIVDRPKRTTGTDANVPLRGIEPAAYDVRGNIKIIEGRRLETGRNEVIVGAGAASAFAGLGVGESFKVGETTWEVVGVFTADGGVSESEIWGDATVVQQAYKRENSFQSIHVRLTSPSAFVAFEQELTKNRKLPVKVEKLSAFYAQQSQYLTTFVTGLGVFIASLMGLGALFGALNTMYGAISARTREIATLRAMGFGASPVVLSVLAESLALALIGGALGAGIAYFAFNGLQTSTMNWQTFSQVTFAFAVTPSLLVLAVIWAAVLGLLGGIFPAIRAARLPIASALRETT